MPIAKKNSRRTAASPPAKRPRSRGITRHLRDIAKTAAQAFEELGVKRRSRWRELIKIPRSLLPHFHQAGAPQVRQMSRDRWLRELQDFYEVAHAQFAWLDETQNPQAYRVRKRPKHQVNLGFGRRRHIRLCGLDQSPTGE
jgi:hypothetical protein